MWILRLKGLRSFFFLQLLESTNKEKSEALQRRAASLEDQLKGQKVKESSRSFYNSQTFLKLVV